MFLKWKYAPNGEFLKIKARLVAGGHRQHADTYTDTASPTINPITVMTILNIIAVEDMECKIFDIKGAFLAAPIEPTEPDIWILLSKEVTELWITLHPEYSKYVTSNGCMYMKLKKYMYGLKQASRKFLELLKNILINNGFKQSISDECMFLKYTDLYITIVATHVDDLLVSCKYCESIDLFEKMLLDHFDINKQEGDKLSYIGLSIERNRTEKYIIVSQRKYFEDIIKKYKDHITRSRSTPMDLNYSSTSVSGADSTPCNKTEYLSLIMLLMYIARFTMPNILFSTVYLATKCDNPTTGDLKAAYKIVSYMYYTGPYAYKFYGNNISVHVYVDASHGIHNDGHGHTGIAITLGSAPIMIRSVKQKLVALHSTDAEIIGVTEALTYVIWIRLLLSELRYELDGPTPIYQDNQSAMILYNGGGNFKRSKHMLTKTSYIKDLIQNKIVDFQYLESTLMLADPLTKPVPSTQMNYVLSKLNIIKI
jgi:hypothetical protein